MTGHAGCALGLRCGYTWDAFTGWRNFRRWPEGVFDLVFRDPYILDFLGLTDRYLEKDLEDRNGKTDEEMIE